MINLVANVRAGYRKGAVHAAKSAAAAEGDPLPGAYRRLYRLWFAFGFPAFVAVLAIVWLIVARPDLPGLF